MLKMLIRIFFSFSHDGRFGPCFWLKINKFGLNTASLLWLSSLHSFLYLLGLVMYRTSSGYERRLGDGRVSISGSSGCDQTSCVWGVWIRSLVCSELRRISSGIVKKLSGCGCGGWEWRMRHRACEHTGSRGRCYVRCGRI